MSFSQVTLTVNGTPYTFNVNAETTSATLFDGYNADINQIASVFSQENTPTVNTLGSTAPSTIPFYSYIVPPSPSQQLANGYINSQVLGNFAYVYLSSPPDASAIAEYGLSSASAAQIAAIHAFESANNLSSPAGLIYVTNRFTTNPFPVTTTAGLNAAQVGLLKLSLSDLWETTANGKNGNFYTGEMVNNLSMLFLSLQMIGIDPRNVDQFSDTDVRWNAWKDLALASPLLQKVFQFPSTASNRTLQSLIELNYVKTGNDMISQQLGNLVSALSTTEQVLNSLGGLQEIANNMYVPNRDRLSTLFDITLTNKTNADYIAQYKVATSSYFGGPIFPGMRNPTGTQIDNSLAFLLGLTPQGGANLSYYPGSKLAPAMGVAIQTSPIPAAEQQTFAFVHFNTAPSQAFLEQYNLEAASENQLKDIAGYEYEANLIGSKDGNPVFPSGYYVTRSTFHPTLTIDGITIPPFPGHNSNHAAYYVAVTPDDPNKFVDFFYTVSPLSQAFMDSLGLSVPSNAQKDKIDQLYQFGIFEGPPLGITNQNLYVSQPQTHPITDMKLRTAIGMLDQNSVNLLTDVKAALKLRADGYSIANVNGVNHIFPPPSGNPDAALLLQTFGYTIDVSGFDSLKKELVKQRGVILDTLRALSTSTPASSLNDPNSLYTLTKQVYNDILTSFTTANGSPILSSTPITDALVGLQRWVLDNYNTTSASAGAFQSHMTFAITSAQNLNTSQQQNVQSFLFLFDQYYKSASSILKQLSHIIVQMGQHIKR